MEKEEEEQLERPPLWVLTREINDYHQDGAYYVKAYRDKPTHRELTEQGVPRDRLHHVLSGGGRVKYEEEWFWLTEEE